MAENVWRRQVSLAEIVRKAAFVPTLLTLAAAFGVGVFIVYGEDITALIGGEIFAMTYQFLLLIVLGSGVSVMFQAVTYSRELRERSRRLQREIHLALVSGYNDAKRTRRLLRARGRCDAQGGISAAEYDRHLEALSDAQLSIELATRRIEFNRTLFVRDTQLVNALEIVGKYLNGVVDEWEDVRPTLSPASGGLQLADLPELATFLSTPDLAPRFRCGFKEPFDHALALLEEALRFDA